MKAQALVSVIGLSGQSLFFQVDHFHQAGETLISECLFVEPGGKGFNQAVALSLLGLKVAFLSAVGNDEYGHQCEQYLVKRGIKAHIVYKQNQQTAIASILRNRDGDNQVTVFPGASLSKDDVDHFTSSLASSKALLLQLEVADEVLRVAVNMASKKHQLIVLNPAPYRVIPEDILHKVDILTPNESEARQMAGLDFSSDWGLVVKKLKQLKKRIVVTLGAKGAYYLDNHEEGFIPAFKVACVDSTGAGDAFNAALVRELLHKKTLKEAVRWANAVAAFSVTKPHVLNSYPTSAEVEQFLKEQNDE